MDGLRREYTDADESPLARLRCTPRLYCVLLTMKAPAKDFERFRPIFEAVGQSITFAQ